uniref:L27 domain-containing protein n=1 Tax=Romanomermis culicivorax TaxID=13658 RepID=A0A915IAA4_ROMCU
MTSKNGVNDFTSALSVLKDDVDTQLFTDTFRLYKILSNYISSLIASDITGEFSDTHFLSSSSDCSPADIPTPLRGSKRKEYNELFDLMNNPHFLNLLYIYDVVAQKRFGPILPEVPNEVDEDEGTDIKLIRLNKNQEPLGTTIKFKIKKTIVEYTSRVDQGLIIFSKRGSMAIVLFLSKIIGITLGQEQQITASHGVACKNEEKAEKILSDCVDKQHYWCSTTVEPYRRCRAER